MKKKNWCDVDKRYSESWLRTYLKPSSKNAFYFVNSGVIIENYVRISRKVSFHNTGPNVKKKMKDN